MLFHYFFNDVITKSFPFLGRSVKTVLLLVYCLVKNSLFSQYSISWFRILRELYSGISDIISLKILFNVVILTPSDTEKLKPCACEVDDKS